ncbi:helix-turn-helix transcriptional regulator [Streptomyces mobaraensis NBRC 13819 = DSM 40847]|uniref:Putative transcriptional regulator n=1 Tax=Streptomyces mobaraensis (strain ATCC 29032 / DSM 40847 / JCM 4168 / NBRC 13819 / NCIMB 11159 / IPCR 16-22) TaxID=1223523 RepID=M3CE25_STRM1|nr:helix-turn-helix transcriptional regulator [Streptomyces mobaraensis]EMF02261.1 putative transcriptional regulator [Streptomyces mobaraensis NBRC 13819 = DSM 40847]QTT73518.1 helix-turn-helix transcriptional regulator [Streptomyces mobaraensis NBRC 13819 = DSM 40847]
MNTDALWRTPEAVALIGHRRAGALIRLGRVHLGWRQADLGRRVGCSASTVSRLERSGTPDIGLLRRAAREVGLPTDVLAATVGLGPGAPTTVAPSGQRHAEEDPLRRRSLLAAAGTAVPLQLLAGIDEALAAPPEPHSPPASVAPRLARAHGLFDAGRHAQLLEALPALLADARAATAARTEATYATLSSCYSLASRVLTKIGHYERSRITADRAITYADLSGDPIATAAASRELSIVLRHQGRPDAAQRLVDSALAAVERTGLSTRAQSMAYAQMLCTTSYTAARAGHRDQALALISEASRAARRLPHIPPTGAAFSISPAAVTLYEVGVHWALGDAGAALHVGRELRPGQFPTAERRARMHTDLARAWWQWGKPQQTADALLEALRTSPAEVTDRPAIRRVAVDLVNRHPHTAGWRELAAGIGLPAR